LTATASKAYTPYGGARSLWSTKAREVLFDGPAGTGKTRAAVEKGVLQAMKYPGCRILFVRKTRASLTESVLVTLETHVAPDQGWIRGQKRSHRQAYILPNGSTIVCGGLDNVDRIMSTEYDAVYLFEATEATEDDWEKLITRLRNGIMPYQQAVADCNPSSPKHWLKARADANKMKRIMSRHEDNPKVTKDYLASLAALSGHRRDRLYKGKWVAAEGLIYDMWDEAVFVQRPEAFVPTRAIIGIDEGYTNPCSKHLYLVDGDGRLYIQREDYTTQQLEAQVVEVIQGWASEYTEILEAIVVDPSAAKLIGSLENVGLPVEPATNSVYDGIKAVQERLKVAGDGKPRTYIDPSCTNLIEEIGGYAWKENRDGSHEDKPTKQNDHAMDELRYVCMYLAETDGAYEVFKL